MTTTTQAETLTKVGERTYQITLDELELLYVKEALEALYDLHSVADAESKQRRFHDAMKLYFEKYPHLVDGGMDTVSFINSAFYAIAKHGDHAGEIWNKFNMEV